MEKTVNLDQPAEMQLCLELNRALFKLDADLVLHSFCQLMKHHGLTASPALVRQIPLQSKAEPEA